MRNKFPIYVSMKWYKKCYLTVKYKIFRLKKTFMMSNYSNNSNMTSNSYSQVGGLAFFLVYISDYLPYVIIVSSGTVIGIIGINIEST